MRRPHVLLVLSGLLLFGCATAQQSILELDALRQVDVDFGGTREETLAGISIDRLRNPERLGLREAGILASAIGSGDMPMRLIVDLDARNAKSNHQTARILAIDWRLLLDEREAVNGTLGAQPAIAPGDSIRIPLGLEFDLLELVGDDLKKLLRVALGFAGYGEGHDINASLMMTPTVETALGPLRFPQEIRIRLN